MKKNIQIASVIFLAACGQTKIQFNGKGAISTQVQPAKPSDGDVQTIEPAVTGNGDSKVLSLPQPDVTSTNGNPPKSTPTAAPITVAAVPTAAPAPTAAPGGASASPVVLPLPVAKLEGVPQGVSAVTKLDIEVGGLGVLSYKYTMSTAGKACDDTKYSQAISTSKHIVDDLSALPDGTITLCVKGISPDGTEQQTASQISFVKDTAQGIASISGAPAGHSNETKLNVSIAGNGVTEYIYGFGIDCNTVTYSASKKISDAPKIQDDISSLPDGPTKLCVKGISKDPVSGQSKTQANASFVTWTKDTQKPTAVIIGAPQGDSSADSIALAFEDAYQYKFAIESGTTCKESSYSELRSGPMTIDVSKLATGPVTLCVLSTDAAGNQQTQPTVHTWNRVGAGGVTLIGVPTGESDITKLKVTVKTSSTNYKYAIVEGSSCNGAAMSADKASSTLIEDTISSLKEGPVSLCVQTKVDEETYVAEATWTKATLPKPNVVVKGVPTGESNAMGLSALVVSKDARGYRYVVSPKESDCVLSKASNEYDINEFISESLVDFPMGPMNLCVWGIDKGAKPFGPTIMKWTKQLARCEGGIASGTLVERTRHKTDAVPWDKECEAPETQKALCDNGYLSWSGSYRFESCKVTPPESCQVGATTVAHLSSRDFYSAAIDVDCNSKKQSRSCVNGTLSGNATFDKPSCDIPKCDGKPYGTPEERTRYESNNPLGACNSEKQTRTCQTNQTWTAWTGTFTQSSCNAGCTSLRHGASGTYYQQSTSYGCSDKTTRTCNNGTLTGNTAYQFDTCTNNCTANLFVSCSGNYSQHCNASATGLEYRSVVGQCGMVCSPNTATGCTGTYYTTCNASGTGYNYAQYSGYCGYVCSPGSTSCSGQYHATCNSSGTGYQYDLINGVCGYTAQVCSPYSFQWCNGTQSVTCNYNGTGYDYSYVNGQCGYSTAPSGCTTQDGVWMANGESRTFYTVSHSPVCYVISTTVRTCSGGTLTGSSAYPYTSCTYVPWP